MVRAKMFRNVGLVVVGLWSMAFEGCTRPSNTGLQGVVAAPDLVVNISGKGSSLPWDIGAFRAASERLPAIREGRFAMTGNSSASIFTAYVSCFGVDDATLDKAEKVAMSVTPDVLAEDVDRITKKLTFGGRAEMEWKVLREIIEKALTDGDGKLCQPKLPVAITAANGDLIATSTGRNGMALFGTPTPEKTWRRGTYEVHEIETSESPTGGTVAGGNGEMMGKRLGRACTTWATPSLADLIERVPEVERMCDLRRIESPEDLLLAVFASCAEPTYYYPILDANTKNKTLMASYDFMNEGTDPYWTGLVKSDELAISEREAARAIWKSDLGERYFVGGFLVINSAQDIVRARPEARVLNITRPPLRPDRAYIALKAWYTMDVEDSFLRNKWWADMEVVPPDAWWAKVAKREVPRETFAKLGFDLMKDCLVNAKCFPTTKAIAPISERATAVDGRRIEMGRGLKELMKN